MTGKRVDLRFGSFACSLQGFHDPAEPVAALLRMVQDRLDGAWAGGPPLFDAETLERIEHEIGALADGDLSAAPGLVLTLRPRMAEAPVDAAEAPAAEEAPAAADAPEPVDEPEAAERDAEPDRPEPAPETEESEAASTAAPEAGEQEASDAREVTEEVTAPNPPADPGEEADQEHVVAEASPSAEADRPAGDPQPEEAADTGSRTDEADAPIENAWEVPAPPPFDPDEATVSLFAEPPDDTPEPEPQDAGRHGEADDWSNGGADETYAGSLEEERQPAAAFGSAGADGPPVSNIFEDPDSPAPGEPSIAVPARLGVEEPAPWTAEADEPGNIFGEPDDERVMAQPDAMDEIEDEPDDLEGRVHEFRQSLRNGQNSPEERAPREISLAALVKTARAEAVPDLMAVSAAWLSLARGQHDFTRKEVISVFDDIPGSHARTAEAKIKGFGKLVRNGQIQPSGNNRFALSAAERDRYSDMLD